MNSNNNSTKSTDLNSKKAAVNQEIKQAVHLASPIDAQKGSTKEEIRRQDQHNEGSSSKRLHNQAKDNKQIFDKNQESKFNKNEFLTEQGIDPKLVVNQLSGNEQIGLVSGMKTAVINQVPIIEQREVVVGTKPKYEEQDVIIGNVPIIETREVVVGSKPVYGKKKVMVGQVPVTETRDVVVGQRMVVEQQLNPQDIQKQEHKHEHKEKVAPIKAVKTVPVTETVPVVTNVPIVTNVPVGPPRTVPASSVQNTQAIPTTMPRTVPTNNVPLTRTAPTTNTAQAPNTSVGHFKHGARLVLKSKHDKYLTADEDGKIKQSKKRGDAETWAVEALGGNLFGLRNASSGSFLSSDDKSLRLNSARAEEEKWRVEMLEGGKYALSDYRGQYLHGGHFKHMSLNDSLSANEHWTVENV